MNVKAVYTDSARGDGLGGTLVVTGTPAFEDGTTSKTITTDFHPGIEAIHYTWIIAKSYPYDLKVTVNVYYNYK